MQDLWKTAGHQSLRLTGLTGLKQLLFHFLPNKSKVQQFYFEQLPEKVQLNNTKFLTTRITALWLFASLYHPCLFRLIQFVIYVVTERCHLVQVNKQNPKGCGGLQYLKYWCCCKEALPSVGKYCTISPQRRPFYRTPLFIYTKQQHFYAAPVLDFRRNFTFRH